MFRYCVSCFGIMSPICFGIVSLRGIVSPTCFGIVSLHVRYCVSTCSVLCLLPVLVLYLPHISMLCLPRVSLLRPKGLRGLPALLLLLRNQVHDGIGKEKNPLDKTLDA